MGAPKGRKLVSPHGILLNKYKYRVAKTSSKTPLIKYNLYNIPSKSQIMLTDSYEYLRRCLLEDYTNAYLVRSTINNSIKFFNKFNTINFFKYILYKSNHNIRYHTINYYRNLRILYLNFKFFKRLNYITIRGIKSDQIIVSSITQVTFKTLHNLQLNVFKFSVLKTKQKFNYIYSFKQSNKVRKLEQTNIELNTIYNRYLTKRYINLKHINYNSLYKYNKLCKQFII